MITDTVRAAKFLVTGPLILGMLFVVNLMSNPGVSWFKWAAFGLGIAWIVSLMKVIRAVVVIGGLTALGMVLRKHFLRRNG